MKCSDPIRISFGQTEKSTVETEMEWTLEARMIWIG